MKREVIVTITPAGEIEVKVQGHAGPGCKDLTKQLEAALGETTGDAKTTEFNLPDQEQQRQQAGR